MLKQTLQMTSYLENDYRSTVDLMHVVHVKELHFRASWRPSFLERMVCGCSRTFRMGEGIFISIYFAVTFFSLVTVLFSALHTS